MRAIVAVAIVGALTRSARADDDAAGYLPISPVQVGIGGTAPIGNQPYTDHHAFDATLRVGYLWLDTPDVVRPGLFFEAHTIHFDSCDFALGPQLQVRLRRSLALQLRAGVGGGPDGTSYAEAGLQIGNLFGGLSVTGRREFDDGSYRVSVDVELSPLFLLVPFMTWPRID